MRQYHLITLSAACLVVSQAFAFASPVTLVNRYKPGQKLVYKIVVNSSSSNDMMPMPMDMVETMEMTKVVKSVSSAGIANVKISLRTLNSTMNGKSLMKMSQQMGVSGFSYSEQESPTGSSTSGMSGISAGMGGGPMNASGRGVTLPNHPVSIGATWQQTGGAGGSQLTQTMTLKSIRVVKGHQIAQIGISYAGPLKVDANAIGAGMGKVGAPTNKMALMTSQMMKGMTGTIAGTESVAFDLTAGYMVAAASKMTTTVTMTIGSFSNQPGAQPMKINTTSKTTTFESLLSSSG